MGEAVKLKRDGGLAIVTLDRPGAMNALNMDLSDGLVDAVVACDEDPNVRAVLITGEGSVFCAGGDIRAMLENADDDGRVGVFLKKLTIGLHAAIATIARMPKPVIAAVNGTAAGAGFSLAMGCDLILAADTAKFTMAYTKIGLVPDGSSTYFLPRLVGSRRALDLMLTNRVLSANEARDIGIVSEIYPEKEFAAKARAFAGDLAAGPTQAYGFAKRLVTQSGAESLETQMEHERRAIAACGNSEDFREGTAAFLEKRKPDYVGR